MTLQPWDPWQELEKLRATTDQLWEEFLHKLRHTEPEREEIGFLPQIDMVETAQDFRIYVSVPGLVEEDIDLTIHDNLLIVRGQREPPYDAQRAASRIVEWRYGIFERQVQLPQKVESSSLRACYESGVLTVVISKCEE